MRNLEYIIGFVVLLAIGLAGLVWIGEADPAEFASLIDALNPNTIAFAGQDRQEAPTAESGLSPMTEAALASGVVDPQSGELNPGRLYPDPAGDIVDGVLDLPNIPAPSMTQPVAPRAEPDPLPKTMKAPRNTSFDEVAAVYDGVDWDRLAELNPLLDPEDVPEDSIIHLPETAKRNPIAVEQMEQAYAMRDAAGGELRRAGDVLKESLKMNPKADHGAVMALYRDAIEAAKTAQQAAQQAEAAANDGDTAAAMRARVDAIEAMGAAKEAADKVGVEVAHVQIDAALEPVSDVLQAFSIDANPVPSAVEGPAAEPTAVPAPNTDTAPSLADTIEPANEQQAQAIKALDCDVPTPADIAEALAGSLQDKIDLQQRMVKAKACMDGN